MLAEIGYIALILALLVAGVQSIAPMIGAHRGDARLMAVGDRCALAQAFLVAFSFVLLTMIFVGSDFSVKLAASHSHTAKPLLYKITGVWANHEGSMLLWILILSVFGALAVGFGKNLPRGLRARALAVQGMIGFGFLAFSLLTSNPFERLFPIPSNGAGLNPLLQDIGLAIHPPLLYIGYVGFSMSFSFAVAALIEGRVDAVWAKWLRPWVLLAWSFLTLGITIGSIWAYYELGWGGWWMWDPVENVSFMPWLMGTALLHSIMVLGTRHVMASWTILLAISTFSLSLIGTFVVRSGILVSVHSFAVDPARGVVILALIGLTTGGALILYALRANSLRSTSRVSMASREGGLVINNLLLVIATITVFLGTFYPLFMDAVNGEKISVGKPYFDLVFTPIMLLLVLFMGVAPLLTWRGNSLSKLRPFLLKALGVIALVAALTFVFGKSILGALAIGLAAYLAFATLSAFARKIRLGQVSRTDSAALAKRQSASTYGFVLAHLGMAVFIVGATLMSVWAKEDIAQIQIGDSVQAGGYVFTLDTLQPGQKSNYQFLAAELSVTKDGKDIAFIDTERRYFPVRDMTTSEAGFRLSFGTTLFAAIGEGDTDNGWIVRAYSHPGVAWIWIGALMIALGGFVSLADRRLAFRALDPAPSKLASMPEAEPAQ